MGITYTEITLKNAGDVIMVNRGLMQAEEVRSVTVWTVADTGAAGMVITEEVREKLGLRVERNRQMSMANGPIENCPVTETVEVHWKDRMMTCQAVVVSGEGFPLFGAVPMEEMDLMVNPCTQEVVGTHGDVQIGLLL
ncbi:hypothetical protein AGMMS49942_16910 [Spirochaetia bacterium]|nr:hypothetical protein AGMMS49942_16910 [Spirochaetia bacterium]